MLVFGDLDDLKKNLPLYSCSRGTYSNLEAVFYIIHSNAYIYFVKGDMISQKSIVECAVLINHKKQLYLHSKLLVDLNFLLL